MANTPTQFCEIKMAPEGYQRAVYGRDTTDTNAVGQGDLVYASTAAGLVKVAGASESTIKSYVTIDYLGDSTPDVSEINKVTVLKDAGIQIYTNNIDIDSITPNATTDLGKPVTSGEAATTKWLADATLATTHYGCFKLAIIGTDVILGYIDATDASGVYITLA